MLNRAHGNSMKKYAIIFLLIYVAFNGLLAFSMELLDPKLTIFLGFMSPLMGCLVTAIKFSKDHLREPNQKEVKILSWLALIGVWAISLSVPIALLLIIPPAEREFSVAFITTNGAIPILFGSVALSSLISFVAIRSMFSLCARLATRNSSVKTLA